jgi:hypothetical protein
MRHGRAKQARKTLQFFERSITAASSGGGSGSSGKQSAYHVVVDGTFVVSILQYKIPILDRLDVLLQHTPFHLYVCKSTVSELHTLHEQRLQPKSKKRSAIAVEKCTRPDDIFLQAMQWCHDNCQILSIQARVNADEEISDIASSSESLSAAASDIVALVTGSSSETSASTDPQSKRYYFCASQDEELLQRLRSISSLPSSRMLYVPLIRLARGTVLLLEQPSKSATRTNTHHERTKWTHNSTFNGPAVSANVTGSSKNTGSASVRDVVAEKEQELVQLVRQELKAKRSSTTIPVEIGATIKSRPPSKARGPNPLSCKKKQSNKSSTTIRLPPPPKTSHPIAATKIDTAKTATDSSQSAESRPRKRRRKTNSNASAVSVP